MWNNSQRWLVFTCGLLFVGGGWGQTSIVKSEARPKSIDTWERQKECLEAAKQDWVRVFPRYKDYEWSWTAHYSPHYGHCFIRIQALDLAKAVDDSVAGTTFIDVLRDALENRVVANVLEIHPFPGKTPILNSDAGIESNHAPLIDAKAFIEDHMNH